MRTKQTMEDKAEKETLKSLGSNKKKQLPKNTGNAPVSSPAEPVVEKSDPPPASDFPVNPVVENNPPPAPADTKYQPNPDYKSFAGPVDVREYQVAQIDNTLTTPIPEQEFQIPTRQLSNLNAPANQIAPNPVTPGTTPSSNTSATQNPPPPPPVQPMEGFTELAPDQKREGAAMLTDMVLSGYKALHKVGQSIVEVSDDDLLALHVDKKIDMTMIIPLSEDGQKYISLQDFFKNYNAQTKTALTVSDDFIKSVREPMIRICIKNGWYMKDEYFVLYKFGEDLGIKVMMIANFKKTINKTLKTFQFVYEKERDEKEAEKQKNNPPPVQYEQAPVEMPNAESKPAEDKKE